jgi:hypothetical protein
MKMHFQNLLPNRVATAVGHEPRERWKIKRSSETVRIYAFDRSGITRYLFTIMSKITFIFGIAIK